MSDDAMVATTQYYKSIFENDRIRLLEYRGKVGAKMVMHSHPDQVAYAVTPAKVRFTIPDGQSIETALNAGDPMFASAVSHATENIGTGNAHILLFELK